MTSLVDKTITNKNSNKIIKEIKVSISWNKPISNHSNQNNHNNNNKINKEDLISWTWIITPINHKITIICNKINKDLITNNRDNNQIWWTSMEINNLKGIKITDIRCSLKIHKWDSSNNLNITNKWTKASSKDHKWTNKVSNNQGWITIWIWDFSNNNRDFNNKEWWISSKICSKDLKWVTITFSRSHKIIIRSTKEIKLNLIKSKKWKKCLILWIFDSF